MNAPFNPSFIDVTSFSTRAVKALGHQDDVAPAAPRANPLAARLRAAADAFLTRQHREPRNTFLDGKAATCLDMAAKLDRFGSFVSDRQHDFALKLIDWSGVDAQQGPQNGPGAPIAAPAAPTPAPAPAVRLEALFDVMQRMAKLRLGNVTIARKNGDSLCWVKWAGHEQVIGKIEHGVLTVFAGRLRGVTVDEVQARLRVINLDPKAAAAAHGQESGNCSVCGRDLTDPASIALGIGPICLGNFGA